MIVPVGVLAEQETETIQIGNRGGDHAEAALAGIQFEIVAGDPAGHDVCLNVHRWAAVSSGCVNARIKPHEGATDQRNQHQYFEEHARLRRRS